MTPYTTPLAVSGPMPSMRRSLTNRDAWIVRWKSNGVVRNRSFPTAADALKLLVELSAGYLAPRVSSTPRDAGAITATDFCIWAQVADELLAHTLESRAADPGA